MKSKRASQTPSRVHHRRKQMVDPFSPLWEEGDDPVYFTVLRALLEDSPPVLKPEIALGALRARNISRLLDWADRLNTEVFSDLTLHFVSRQLAALVRKYPWKSSWIPEIDPKRAALETFERAERQCKRTNLRFNRRGSLYRSRFYPLLEDMRRWISSVVGSRPNLDEVYRNCGFGPGASLGVHGNATSLHRKVLASEWTCTPEALPFATTALGRNPRLRELILHEPGRPIVCYDEEEFVSRVNKKVTKVTSNKLGFVPKTAKTFRTIAVEPLLNGFVQMGIDTVLRRRLAGSGLFLDTQLHNQLLAREGSAYGTYATVDLSSASDTVSTSLVYYLLPGPWFDLMNRVRSHSGTLPGSKSSMSFAKFSSMGNNFTFPLETLIFAAAARASMRASRCWGSESWAIYGDDIVVPTAAYEILVPLLRFLGFSPNQKKCFSSGDFRESCGADWHRGRDVRPVEVDYQLNSIHSLMVFHNACQRGELTRNFFAPILHIVRDAVPEPSRFMRPSFGPSTSSRYASSLAAQRNLNGAFTVPLDVMMASRHVTWSKPLQTWKWKEFQFSARNDYGIERDLNIRRDSHPFQFTSYMAFLSGQPDGEPTLRYTTKCRITVK